MKSLLSYTRNIGQPWTNARHANDSGVVTTEAEEPSPQPFSEATLGAVSRHNEGLRARFATIVQRSDELFALRGEFIDAAEQVGNVLRVSEVTHASLVERTNMLQRLEDSHAELKARYRAARDESETASNEVSVLKAQIDHFDDLVRNRETLIKNLENNLAQETARAAGIAAELEEQRSKTELVEEDLKAAQARLEKDDVLIANLQGEAIALTAQCSVVNFHLSTLQTNLADSQKETREARETLAATEGEANELERRLTEVEFELANRTRKVESAESSLSLLHVEHDAVKRTWQDQSEAHVKELTALRSEIDELRARAVAGDGLVEEARAELQSRVNELRKSERRAEQAEAKLTQLEERWQATSADLAETSDKLLTAERSRTHIANRAQALVRAMKDQKVMLSTAEHRASVLEERHVADVAQFDQVAEGLRRTIQELTEQLEKEKLARLVVAGALEVARSRPVDFRSEPEPGAVLAPVDTAEPLALASQTVQETAVETPLETDQETTGEPALAGDAVLAEAPAAIPGASPDHKYEHMYDQRPDERRRLSRQNRRMGPGRTAAEA